MEQTAPTEMTAVIRDEALLELADFDEVVRLYRPRIFRFLISSLGDRDTAESLTQDCFLKAWNARNQFRGESSLSTWLTRIAVNLMRDHLRSRRLRFWQKSEKQRGRSAGNQRLGAGRPQHTGADAACPGSRAAGVERGREAFAAAAHGFCTALCGGAGAGRDILHHRH